MNLEALQERIREAAARKAPLRLRGGGSKDFYGNEPRGELLDTRGYAGIVSYEPTELVVTARCGTLLAELERILGQNGQCLPFEPPHFGPEATLGGCVATGLSGPRRASAGALRDFVLGVKLVDGRGRELAFGGQVMKNVAGYDVARLVAGSLGTLGLIAEVSLKVLPSPACELSLELEVSEAAALERMNLWAGQPLPISATAWHASRLCVRLSGAEPAVRAAAAKIGGTRVEAGQFWEGVREHRHAFFDGPQPLWRVAVPSVCPPLGASGDSLIEWGGALRWLRGAEARALAAKADGHATLFRSQGKRESVFAALDPLVMTLHRRLKAAFDPAGILNPGRLYAEL
ncbi:MAG TPA: glycolate oxidase subunit GlcE [Burkholderiales bacterium]|nr:glycolate oxidase subunit GlcE [Burkholderiales bacterium]